MKLNSLVTILSLAGALGAQDMSGTGSEITSQITSVYGRLIGKIK